MDDYSIYIHIPFCTHRCGYCDFNTYAGIEALIPVYIDAICNEIDSVSRAMDSKLKVHTIYFGGGTPSLVPVSEYERVFQTLDRNFALADLVEVSLEANPGTLTLAYLNDLRSLGVNRLSIGMQTADADELRILERIHTLEDVLQSVKWARMARFDNLNLDLIYGMPSQDHASWQRSLECALEMQPEHLSLYALTLEHGTPMQIKVERGLLDEPDVDEAADMYEWSMARLDLADYRHYEISNWAKIKPDNISYQCNHNLQYWRNRNYLGFGAGAHGYAQGVRLANVNHPNEYIQRCRMSGEYTFPISPASISAHEVNQREDIGETMMMGLRLVHEGVSNQVFKNRFGISLIEMFGRQIDALVRKGLLEWIGVDKDVLCLTRRGCLMGNQVFMEFI